MTTGMMKRKYLDKKKICPGVALSTINPRWTPLGSNPRLRGERQSTRAACLPHRRSQTALHQLLKLKKA